MSKKSTSSASKAIIKEARKQGRKDGKNQVPRQDWGVNSVPYLVQLQRQFAAYGRELDLAFEQKKFDKEAQKIESLRKEIQEKGKSSSLTNSLMKAEVELEKAQAKLDGGPDEVPMAKFARIRMIGNSLYLPFLAMLFIGEFTITAPAFRILLGEKLGPSLIVTLAVSTLSVGAAHIFGVYLKSVFDRSRPKSRLYNGIFITVGLFVSTLIVILSNVRARNSVLTSGNLPMSDSAKYYYLWALYSILQLTFVTVGVAISFMHFSEIESTVLRAKRTVWYLRHRQTRREAEKTKSGASIEEADIDTTKLAEREMEVIESKKILLRAQYEEACAVYRNANIDSRRDEMNAAHLALKALELDFRTSGLEFSTAEFARN